MLFQINITDDAKRHLQKTIKDDQAIMLGVEPSGCSGYSYVMNTVDSNTETYKKKTLKKHNFNEIPFLIANEDLNYLNNITIKYVKEGVNSKIIFENPQAVALCGCGTSFAIN